MNKLGIVITDGVGFRNFICSDFISHVTQQFDKVVIYSGLSKESYNFVELDKIELKELPVFVENKFTWFFRKWKEISHLQKFKKNFGMNDNLQNTRSLSKYSLSSIAIKLIYLFTYFIHTDKSIIFIEKLQFLSFSRNKITLEYKKMLKKDKPTHLFFTHQRPPFLAPFLYAAQRNKISISTFIFSWDNLSSKGRMLGSFDYFLVWSNLMKKELLEYYPDKKPNQIEVVGTPQFEPYVMTKYETKKDDFYTKFDLDKTKKTICFSCAEASIGGNDPIVIESIITAIRKNKINKPCQLLVRTSPAESETRFEHLKLKYPEIKWNFPKWNLTRENHKETWSQRVPKEEDIKDLRSILEYSDLNINMCSTMSLDFMLFDKPVINTVFGNSENGLYDDQRFLNYTHFKIIVDSGAVAVAKNKLELVNHINRILEKPEESLEKRKAIVALEIGKKIEGTSNRIVQTLKKWST